ncbi:hypothetical protein [Paraburkholderia unamae]|uniref:hypothetical protein n=1 Tax=Paraburkholderia unamae TaxID=219649 RepID=UPI0011BDFC97|nr:hypothetical protein [Paraburkholderia unamae]
MLHPGLGSPQALPDNDQMPHVGTGEDVAVAELTANVIPNNWLENANGTQAAGSGWLAAGQVLLRKALGEILPHSYNYPFNPAHTAAGPAIVAEVMKVSYDSGMRSILRDM